jgi:hypothetical protein
MAGIIVSLATGSVLSLVALSHDRPLHHAYACEFARDFRQEVHLPPAPCHDPGRPCTFDGGGTAASGSVTRTDTGRWACADGQLYKIK